MESPPREHTHKHFQHLDLPATLSKPPSDIYNASRQQATPSASLPNPNLPTKTLSMCPNATQAMDPVLVAKIVATLALVAFWYFVFLFYLTLATSYRHRRRGCRIQIMLCIIMAGLAVAAAAHLRMVFVEINKLNGPYHGASLIKATDLADWNDAEETIRRSRSSSGLEIAAVLGALAVYVALLAGIAKSLPVIRMERAAWRDVHDDEERRSLMTWD